ncbi:MAG: hypothetical protein KU38_09790 [Sulfurovum sp. FS08-3]|nr:MAG: hypothetical protein KU38_09790 [Sulfurovum sp. FS08-3]
MQTVSVSQIQRNLHQLNEFDIIEIIDKKRNQTKGYFLDSSYKPLIDEIIHQKEQQDSNLLKIVGIVGDSQGTTRDSLRDERLARYA